MKREKWLFVLVTLLCVVGLLVTGCAKAEEPGEEEVATEGQLPIYHVGDKWVLSGARGGTTTVTREVIGEERLEGRDCYVMGMSYDPVLRSTQGDVECTVTGHREWIDKATVFYSTATEELDTCNGTVHTSTQTCSYNPWASLFPLKIGKEVEMRKDYVMHQDGRLMQTGYHNDEKYEIVGKEEITVTAGTFSCWKIIHETSGDVITFWWSDQAKYAVQMMDSAGHTIELQSYSVR